MRVRFPPINNARMPAQCHYKRRSARRRATPHKVLQPCSHQRVISGTVGIRMMNDGSVGEYPPAFRSATTSGVSYDVILNGVNLLCSRVVQWKDGRLLLG